MTETQDNLPETPPQGERLNREEYLRIWEVEQNFSTKRWTIGTFFFGISFALLGFSFQTENSQVPLLVQYSAAIFVYWFGYALFVRLNVFSKFLRGFLSDAEQDVKIYIQKESRTYMRQGRLPSATNLLRIFGIVYSVGVVLSWFLRN